MMLGLDKRPDKRGFVIRHKYDDHRPRVPFLGEEGLLRAF
jgi:hypothetical protein